LPFERLESRAAGLWYSYHCSLPPLYTCIVLLQYQKPMRPRQYGAPTSIIQENACHERSTGAIDTKLLVEIRESAPMIPITS
jgi:hypothetical protein